MSAIISLLDVVTESRCTRMIHSSVSRHALLALFPSKEGSTGCVQLVRDVMMLLMVGTCEFMM